MLSLLVQELRRLLKLGKAANEARAAVGVWLKDSRDDMPQPLDLKPLNGLFTDQIP